MDESDLGTHFLQRKYKLNTDPGVVATARKTKVPEHQYQRRIQDYLDRLAHLINPFPSETHSAGFDRGRRNLNILKKSLYDQVIIKPEEIPEGYWQSIIKRHEEEGRPIDTIPDDVKKDLTDTLIKDQRESLNIWIDYLTSPDAKYPDWFKYYALRSILVMGRYDKGKRQFTERSKTGKSVNMFPELIRDALSFVADAIEAKQKKTVGSLEYGHGIQPEEKQEFKKLLQEGDANFARLYAWAIDKITPISEEMLQETRGSWIKYPKGSDPKKVVEALAQYGTGWCIRGKGTAATYLKSSDLEIYFSLDKDGNPTVPRIVIVTRDGKIDEVRGVAEQEHWDQYITNVVEQKLAELPDGKKFKKRVADMQKMTAIHRKCFSVDKETRVKTYLNPTLTPDELRFLYQVDGNIEGFGYQIPDPRIEEILGKRNPEEDMLVILGCERSQIARNPGEINQNTKAYVGPLVHYDQQGQIIPIFKLFKRCNIKCVYTSFPEGKIIFDTIEIGGKSAEQLEAEIKKIGGLINLCAKSMLHSQDFTTLKNPTSLDIVRLKVSDLGFDSLATTDQIYKRAQELGIDLCPAEVGPHLRLKDQNQPIGNWYCIGMKKISGSVRGPDVFMVDRFGERLWLHVILAEPGVRWLPRSQFVFALRKQA
jgi:hypothetical protein